MHQYIECLNFNAHIICNHDPQPWGMTGESQANVSCFYFGIDQQCGGNCQGFDIPSQTLQWNKKKFRLWVVTAMVLTGGYSRDLLDEKSVCFSCVGGGGGYKLVHNTSTIFSIDVTTRRRSQYCSRLEKRRL